MPPAEGRCLPPRATRHWDWLSNEPLERQIRLCSFCSSTFHGLGDYPLPANKGCFRVSKMEKRSSKKHAAPSSWSVCSPNEKNWESFLRRVVRGEENGGKRLTNSLEIDKTSHFFIGWTFFFFLCCLKTLLMCSYTPSSWTLRDASKVDIYCSVGN